MIGTRAACEDLALWRTTTARGEAAASSSAGFHQVVLRTDLRTFHDQRLQIELRGQRKNSWAVRSIADHDENRLGIVLTSPHDRHLALASRRYGPAAFASEMERRRGRLEEYFADVQIRFAIVEDVQELLR